ncbi:carbohydrate ABC transporter membrane protein 1, CUT1 family [Natronoarchaeum philippinense]|uniref:Carbohydrate ABC transporter membrane protein 1, CUT1 family n=1 Tax=Natronoarchaeum philippinense TaxID=558529 RepID=A0A285NXT2_NATPI|nr:sugar ABC transporter permease [Natronoarchaeum philippinense]SNZ12451.1 carbohydrate ABC transporter membrane protein 1, CUT1 family [Natronoarchaeum philippinense]
MVTLNRSGERTIEEKEALLGYALIAPALLLIGAVILYPVLYNVYLSFTVVPLSPTESPEWIGLGHYTELLNNSAFWSALRTTIVFTFFSTTLATLGGLGTALLFNRSFRGRRYLRGMVLLPYVAPLISVAFVWRFMLDPLYGVVPFVASDVLGLYAGSIDLLSNGDTAIWTVVFIDAWRYFPFAFLMLIARVQAIPNDMYEAAKIDGASKFAQFKDITLSELKYILATVFLLRWIWNFNKFADIWLLTRRVETLPIYAYQVAFANYQHGQAAAISMVLFLALIVFVLVYVAWALDW